MTRGQFIRLFLSNNGTDDPTKVIGAAKQLTLHISVTLENATTKDTDGDWVLNEPTSINYDITSNALIEGGDTVTSQVGAQGLSDLQDIYEAGTPVKWQIANVSGDNQRTKGAVVASGNVILTQLQINGPLQSAASYTATMRGYGEYEVGS